MNKAQVLLQLVEGLSFIIAFPKGKRPQLRLRFSRSMGAASVIPHVKGGKR